MKYFIVFLLVIVSEILFISPVFSQEPTQFESEGTDFWFTFLPNYHNYRGPTSTDSVYIYITSNVATKGTIYYTEFRNPPIPKEQHFEITQPNEIYRISLQYWYIALEGDNHGGYISKDGSNNEIITSKSFHIVTEDKCSVYALDYAETSAEAFIVLPVPALDKEYFVLTYNSDGHNQQPSNELAISSTPSQFAVVAFQDNTAVDITPSAPTANNANKSQHIVLNKGDTYLIQALITPTNLNGDLTGSHIVADKEIAVFAGHQRATTPLGMGSSRDCLIEQLIPFNTWGKNAIITPFQKPPKYNKNNSYLDFFRILAAKDSTIISVNYEIVDTLNSGEYYEAPLIPALISANNAIMVMQYYRSEALGNISGYEGDPLMILVPPIEQYKSFYNVISAQYENKVGMRTEKMITSQYLNIVASDSSVNKIYLDNVLLNYADFTSIYGTGYSFAQIKTTDGGHNIICKDPISVQIYGYGQAVSYGYLGGMSFLDLEHGKISMNVDSCFTNAVFTYNETFNSGIAKYEILESYNCQIEEETLTNNKLKINISKYNVEEVAYFKIKIIDIYGEEIILSDTIHVKMFAISQPPDNLINFGNCKIGTLNTTSLIIYNPGEMEIVLGKDDIEMFHNTRFTIGKSNLPITIQAKDSVIVNVYYNPIRASNHNSTKNFDTLVLNNKCNSDTVYLEGTPTSDTLNINGACNIPIVAIADSISSYSSTPILSPNPVGNEEVTYYFSITEESDASINIYNSLGEKITSVANQCLVKGSYSIQIPIYFLANGIYFIELNTSYNRQSTKFIKY